MRSQIDKARDLAARFGGDRDGLFTPDGLDIAELADRYGTPLYLYSAGMVSERIRRVRTSLGTDLAYSVKANPSLGICQLIASEGIGAEVASAGELAVARAAGFAPSDILFAGPGKTDDELDRLVKEGIYADNVESLREIDRLADSARRASTTIGVGLRINPPTQLMGSQMRMGGSATQFGLDHADLANAIERTQACPELSFRGIHVYTATQVFEVEPLLEHCRNILSIALEAADLAGHPLEMIDFGGGFGVPYFEKTVDFDLERFGTGLRQLLSEYEADPRLAGCRYIFELGRYLVADAGVYVMRVVDVKTTQGRQLAVTDGGMNHHLTATGNMGQVFRKSYPLLNLSRMGRAAETEVGVTGPLCTPLDSFGTKIPLAEPSVGDFIGVFYSGAYGYSASNLGFLSHPTPAEVLLQGGKAHLLRAAGTPEDVLKGQQGLPRTLLGR